MSPQKKMKPKEVVDDSLIDQENERYKLEIDMGAPEPEPNPKRGGRFGSRRASNTGGQPKRSTVGMGVNDSVAPERRQFISQVINDLNKKVDTI